jgi:rRNA-processing protein EBP2
MAKSSSKRRKDRTEISPKDEKRQRIVTMQALQELSSDDDDDDATLPPESEWSKEALALKAAIEAGTFDAAVINKDDEEGDPFEEVDLDDDDEDEEDSNSMEVNEQKGAENDCEYDIDAKKENEDDDSGTDEDENDEDDEDSKEGTSDLDKSRKVEPSESVQNEDSEGDDEEVDSDTDDDEVSPNRSSEHHVIQGKALCIVAASLAAEKKDWPWSETFDIIPPTPLPFADKDSEGGTTLGVHDDLQREVAFYDLALEAVLEAKRRCHSAGIPFTRPADFFAEMVKTDGRL